MRLSRVALAACVLLMGAAIASHEAAPASSEPVRPMPNMIPELYPERYPGLRAPATPPLPLDELPSHFNWCAKPDGGCVPNWQQHLPRYFPLCYLHATLTMVGDRIRHLLHGSGVPDVILSRQDVLDCAGSVGYGQNEGGGGEGVDVLEYLRQHGVPDETCNPFTGNLKGKCDPTARCRNCMMLQDDNLSHCWPVERFVKYRVKDYGFVRGEAAMMSEIQARGPITCGVAVDDEFCFNYRGGVYRDPNHLTDVDHDVEVVGWGEQQQIDGSVLKFWVIRNSWGSYWGHNSFFLLERGVNAMRIEEKCTFANPDISELQAHLAGHNVGSMFGLVHPGEQPRTLPKHWNKAKHDFMSKKDLAAAAAESAAADAWIAANLPDGRPIASGMFQHAHTDAPVGKAVRAAEHQKKAAEKAAEHPLSVAPEPLVVAPLAAAPVIVPAAAPVAAPAAAPAAAEPAAQAVPSGPQSVFESAWFWVLVGFAIVAVITYYCLIRTGQSRGEYAPIANKDHGSSV